MVRRTAASRSIISKSGTLSPASYRPTDVPVVPSAFAIALCVT